MNRTAILKLLYFGAIGVIVPCAIWFAAVSKYRPAVVIGIVLILLIPGRFAGYFWRELIVGRRYLDTGRYYEAIPLLEKFIAKLKRTPWLQLLIWLTPSIYTTSARAMTLNNLGVANLEVGNVEEAEVYLKDALYFDRRYPLPRYNLAIVEMYRNNREGCERHLSDAAILGFTDGSVDKVIQRTKAIYARIEPAARGVS